MVKLLSKTSVFYFKTHITFINRACSRFWQIRCNTLAEELDSSSGNRIVCIVDDDADIATLFRDALTNVPRVSVHSFIDPILALEHFKTNDYNYVLVISDFRMPGLNGMEFLKKVKEGNSFVRTILMTAFDVDDKMFGKYVKKKIINAFIQKPIAIHDLLKEVDSQLHSYEIQKRYPLQK